MAAAGLTSFGESVEEASESAVEVMSEIDFEGMYYRRDIGYEFK